MKEFEINYDDLKNYISNQKSVLRCFYKRGHKKKGIKDMADFYNCIGVDFKELKKENSGVDININQIKINPKTWKKVEDIIKSSYNNNYKGRGEHAYPTMLLFDLMNYSPVEDTDLKEDIVIFNLIKND